MVGHSGIADLAVVPVRLAAWTVALLVVYQWAALVLEFFPYTRPWGEGLFDNLLSALGSFVGNMLEAVPGLLFVALIFFVTRFVVRVVRAFFDGVQAGRIHLHWIDETTARPTGRLLIAIIWLFSLVAAYPYIPGSDSEAFKGIGVFVGLMLSIGASGVVNQAVSGLMLMYTKALRPGEFVQVGETEGTVTAVGFLTTRIETLRNVEVTLPNAFLVSNVTRNLSRLASNGGMRLTTSVTIGYDTPWRQVHAMLTLAAERTSRVSRTLRRGSCRRRCRISTSSTRWSSASPTRGIRSACSTNCTRTSRMSSTSTACRSCRPTTRRIPPTRSSCRRSSGSRRPRNRRGTRRRQRRQTRTAALRDRQPASRQPGRSRATR